MPHVNELHEQHDPILVVSFASGDLSAADRDHATAQALVLSCAECAASTTTFSPLPARRRPSCHVFAHAISGSPTSRRRSFGLPACAGFFPA